MSDLKEQIKKEALRLREDTQYAHKAHFFAAEKWENSNMWLGIPSIILSIMAGSLALSKIVPYFEIFAGLCGFGAAALTALLAFLKPLNKRETHIKFGNKYLSLGGDIRRFFEIDLHKNTSESELKSILDSLVAKKKEIDSDAPLIPNWAYKEAGRRIESGEIDYEVDNI